MHDYPRREQRIKWFQIYSYFKGNLSWLTYILGMGQGGYLYISSGCEAFDYVYIVKFMYKNGVDNRNLIGSGEVSRRYFSVVSHPKLFYLSLGSCQFVAKVHYVISVKLSDRRNDDDIARKIYNAFLTC